MGQGGISMYMSLYSEKPEAELTIEYTKAALDKYIEESELHTPSVVSAIRNAIHTHPAHIKAFLYHATQIVLTTLPSAIILNNISFILSRMLPIIYESHTVSHDTMYASYNEGDCIAMLLCKMIMKMLFYPGYTMHPKSNDSNTWCSGVVYYNKDFDDTTSYDRNRYVVLKMLQSYLSEPCFCTADEVETYSCASFFCVCSSINQYIRILTFSLLNMILKEKNKSFLNKINVFSNYAELKMICMQTLISILAYHLPLANEDKQLLLSNFNKNKQEKPEIDTQYNQAAVTISSIDKITELVDILNMITRLIKEFTNADNVCFLSFAILLAYRLITTNPLLLQVSNYNVSFLGMLDVLIDVIEVSASLNTGNNIIDMTVCILHMLLSEQNIAEMLNTRYTNKKKFPFKVPNKTRYHDILILTISHSLETRSMNKDMLVHAIQLTHQISPYYKKISPQASVAIFAWLEQALSLEFLASHSDAHLHTLTLMNSIVKMLTYHWENNEQLVLELLSKANLISLIPKLKFEHLSKVCGNQTGINEQWFDSWSKQLYNHQLISIFKNLAEIISQLDSKADIERTIRCIPLNEMAVENTKDSHIMYKDERALIGYAWGYILLSQKNCIADVQKVKLVKIVCK